MYRTFNHKGSLHVGTREENEMNLCRINFFWSVKRLALFSDGSNLKFVHSPVDKY